MSQSFSGGQSRATTLAEEDRGANRAARDLAANAGAPGADVALDPAFLDRALAVLDRQRAAQPAREAPPGGLLGAPSPDLASLRREATRLIDDFLGLIAAGVGPMPARPGTIATTPSPPAPTSAPVSTSTGGTPRTANPLRIPVDLPVALSAVAVMAGQVAALTMRVANDGAAPAPLRFAATDLVGDTGGRIPSSAVSFCPHATTVAPNAVQAVDVVIAVTEAIVPGSYAGLIQVVGQGLARSLLTIDVKPSTPSTQNKGP